MAKGKSVEKILFGAKDDGSGGYVTAIEEVGAMSHRTALTITQSAQEIIIGSGKTHIEIQNTGANDIFLGGVGVDSAKGFQLFTDYSKVFSKVKSTFNFYAICASGKTSTLRIVEYS